jgi:hypothetical protein
MFGACRAGVHELLQGWSSFVTQNFVYVHIAQAGGKFLTRLQGDGRNLHLAKAFSG